MPTYEYECKSCGHSFDAFQSMSDEPLSICPQCGRELRRLINGGSGVIFKGSGFYVTDRKAGAAGKAAKAAGGADSAAADAKTGTSHGEAGGKTDGKTAKPADSAALPATSSAAGPVSKSPASAGVKAESGSRGTAKAAG
jgi:putative FmdB family regulatory protein